MAEEKIFFHSTYGLKLCGILSEPKGHSDRIVVLVHGFSSNKNTKTLLMTVKKFDKLGISTFRIDLNGCGESEGKFSETTTSKMVDDTISAIDMMKDKGYEKIELFGSSCGGLTCMIVAIKYPGIQRMALKAPVSDYTYPLKTSNVQIKEWKNKGYKIKINKHGEELKVNYSFYEDSLKYNMYDQVSVIKCPTLFLHGDKDESVPLEQSQKCVKNFPNAKLIVIKGGDHKLFPKSQEALDMMIKWWVED